MGRTEMLLASWILTIFAVSVLQSVLCGKTFTIQDLLTTKFSRKISDDLYLDPCKSEKFSGDIALTRNEYIKYELRKYQLQWNISNVNRTLEKQGWNSVFGKRNAKKNKKNGNRRDSRRRHRHNRAHRRKTRAATARTDRLWDDAVIPYEIDANFSGEHRALFRQAMRHWENYTCIKFVERTSEHSNYIVFTERPCGCCSFVGKRGNGAQAISIGKNCDKFGIVVHELGHVVGFWHEHTRPDRDDHVKIVTNNIMPGQEYNFNKLTGEEVNSLGLPYDYDSIMHYARNTFSKNTYLDTILPQEDPSATKLPEIGQRVKLSGGDIAQTNRLYTCPACGRTIQDPSGVISSSEYSPQIVTPGGLFCEWRITGTHGETISMDITVLDVYGSDDCETDYLEVRDGYTRNSPLLGRFCGSGKVPEKIVTTGHRMLVIYRTSVSQKYHRGFQAKFEALCGGDVIREKGVLQSPNYPEDYHPGKECTWKITVPPNYQISLRFQSFHIENHDHCVYDYLEIRDGHEPTSQILGKFCGHKIPNEVRSSLNKMAVKFVSDTSVQKPGFSATFIKEYDECKGADHGCEQLCVNTVGGYKCDCNIGYEIHSDGKTCEDACGGVIAAVNGTIISPSFPELYPPNKNCVWEIIAPPQYRITMNFTHFDLEGNNHDCEYDSVDVRSKKGEVEIKKHGIFCGTHLPPVITSDGNSLRIEFNSDNSVQKSGFAAVFFTDKDECANENGGCQHICKNTIGSYYCECHNGFVLHENKHQCKEGSCIYHITSPIGQIKSPNFPDFYPGRKDCAWLFATTPGHRIKLVFNEFELEPHQECAYDHIAVYDGETNDNHLLGRFCGSKLPHPLLASGNKMCLVFKSDSSVQRKGFLAIHSTACGGRLSAHSSLEHLYSHAKYGDQNYENKEDCDWIIQAKNGRSIQLRFLTFELEHEQDCSYDYVDIYNGFDDSSPFLGRFCGNKVPPEFISSSDSMLVRFRSDDTINNKGFSAAYVAIGDYTSMIKH